MFTRPPSATPPSSLVRKWEKLTIFFRALTCILALVLFTLLNILNTRGGADTVNALQLSFAFLSVLLNLEITVLFLTRKNWNQTSHIYTTYLSPLLDGIVMGMLILSAFLFLNPGPCDNWTKVEQCFVATAEFMRDKPDPWFDEAQGVWWVRGSANSKLKMDAEGMVLGLTIVHGVFMLSGVWDAVVLLRALKTEKVKNAAGEGEEDAPRKASSGSEV